MSVQYESVCSWDVTLIDLEYTDTENPLVKGLVESAIKITTGAPTATAGKFIKGAQILNAFDGAWYENTGSVASPVWSLVPSTGSGITTLTGDVTAGPGVGSQATLIAKINGVVPESVNKYDVQVTTAGGAPGEVVTITGVASTDHAYVMMVDNGTNNTTIVSAACTLNTVTVTFSADPGNDAIINILVTRATGL